MLKSRLCMNLGSNLGCVEIKRSDPRSPPILKKKSDGKIIKRGKNAEQVTAR